MTQSRYVPRRGDIIQINFSPQAGLEQAGRRPAPVLSPAEYNRVSGLAVACPITNQDKGYPWSVPIPENDLVSGVVLADQIKNIDWRKRDAAFLCTPE